MYKIKAAAYFIYAAAFILILFTVFLPKKLLRRKVPHRFRA